MSLSPEASISKTKASNLCGQNQGQSIRDLFEYALYKFTLYLLTYLLKARQVVFKTKVKAIK